MGLSHSKNRSQVTKVAPMPAKEVASRSPGCAPVYGYQSPLRERRSSSLAPLTERNPLSERHLPPLRETWYSRYPAVPRPSPLDLKPEEGESSIIKQHPPRRPQKLEPLVLPKDVSLDTFSRQREGTAARTPKELEKRGPAVLYPPGRRRQHLHKMKMLEMRQEAERKRRLRRGSAKSKTRDAKVRQAFRHGQPFDSSDDEDLFAVEHDGDIGINPWVGQILKGHGRPETQPGQIGKVETWLLKQQASSKSFWDTSSTDSDSWEELEDGRFTRRPALVRTKTERIQLFDDFFDQPL
ncbi:LOW QUALITY PROTEIN: uncharacterized protein CCDC198 [Sphaerodactylus townsendi]|uniref:LOW QUALITY PROTEIN: uncharacterized protein CCDC198 n=1 Tax=Sphaerodactylus townsendi TaxID=933632 RepID=UPI002026DD22|nr:LOW QUALITY PROTEIN: uncharacterized protein CCDC198 [Sphaerodactylus townsendi]